MARKEYVYFIEDGARVKIGRSYNPEKRLFQIRMEKTKDMKILGSIPHITFEQSVAKENEFHKKFKSIQAKGEWFEKTPELLAFINEVSK